MAPEEPQVFASVLDVLDYKPAFEVVALFSPIGLLDDPTPQGRRCEREARKMLGWPRSGAITSAPARQALGFESYAEAAVANGGGLSAISWRVIKRVEEVEADMAPYLQRTVFEVHPELSFYQLNDDSPVRFSKHTESGRHERRALLERRFPGVERILDVRLRRVSPAQLLDVTACLWTARRIISRSVDRLPNDPEWDAKGLRMEIVR